MKKSDLHQKILAEWLVSVEAGEFEHAIQLDFYHYAHLVKVTEDISYWDRWQKDTYSARVVLSNRIVEVIPDRPIAAIDKADKFAIVNHNYSGLAHEVQLSRNIQFLRQQGRHLNFDVIYLFDSFPDALQRAARLYGVRESNVIFLSAANYKTAAERLDFTVRRENYRTLIYPSIFIMAFWMSLFNSHPRQKFLQMKYYPWQTGRIAQWAGGRRAAGEYYSIHGFNFLQLETLDLEADYALDGVQISPAPEGVTFGSISRPEKIADLDYNHFIESILVECPELTYLYAGRQEGINVIPEAVRRMPNAAHIGWVEPAVAIKNFAIYLEPFPWGGGEMSFLALKAGVPYLSLGTEENIRFGMFDFLRIIASSGIEILQYSFCSTREELRQKLLQLADDPALRQQLGDAWRAHIASWRPSDTERWYEFFMY
jgi:hypothetical protein